MADLKVTKDLDNKKLVIEFTANGSKDKVWQAYADQAMFEQWWGPEGWETTTKEFNFTEGGRIHYGMKCTDEKQGEWFNQTAWGVMEVSEIKPTDSFSYTDHFSDEDGTFDTKLPVLKITNVFTEKDGKTKIVSTSYAESAEQIEELLKMGMVEGFSSQLNKLDKLFQ